ncbi:MAG TPA: hypothetical protein VJ938_12805 [Acidimicrobiia bacterium]|nr:hypothetical protein [Acidimicrobiia bacterium]
MKNDPFDELRRFADDLIRAVPQGRSEAEVARAIRTVTAPRRRRLPALVAASVSGLFVLNLAGAAVADSSAPGDVLYPVDRSYEWVSDVLGLGGDRSGERLEEATVLTDRSEYDAALELMIESLPNSEVVAAARAIRTADLTGTDLRSVVMDLLAVARQISESTNAADAGELAEAEEEVREIVTDLPGDTAPGNTGNTPGQSGDTPGDTAPGNSGTTPGDADPPDNSGDGPPATAPGNSGGNSGNGSSGSTPAVTSPRSGGGNSSKP